jgi:hypothetical protein
MKRAITLTLTVLTFFPAVYLPACSAEPKIKADTESNFNSSFAEVIKEMSAADKQKLDVALKDIVLVQVGLYGPMFDAKNYQLPSNDPHTALFGQSLAAAFTGATTKMIDAVTAAKWDENRAKAVVANARAIIDGRTANEIILIAADERKKALESTIATYREQVEKAKSSLRDIQTDSEAETQRQNDQEVLLEKIVITKPRFSYQKNSYMSQPVVSFMIQNKGNISLKRIFLEGNLQTPGRAVPWIKASFSYEIRGGLEPNETQSLNLAPNMFSDWGKVPQDAVAGAVLTLTLTAFEDASGKRFGQDTGDSDPAARKKALEDAIHELENKITDLQKQLQQGM